MTRVGKSKTALKRPKGTAVRERSLSQEDWIRAGQKLLVDQGIAGMRLTALVKSLNITTGSFYHHFDDMDDYLGKLANYYSSDQIRRLAGEIIAEVDDPKHQLRQLAARSAAQGLFQLDIAMRVWGTSDERAAKSMRAAEKFVLSFISDAFKRIGFNEDEAMLRAQILLSVNVTRLESISGAGNRGFKDRTLNLLMEKS